MESHNLAIIQPLIDKPATNAGEILYPYYIAKVTIRVPRAIGRPRILNVFLLVDGCTKKVMRCDSWPSLMYKHGIFDTVDTRISVETAKASALHFAKQKIARRFLTYWEQQIHITRFDFVYKIFWMKSSTCAIDSLTARKLQFAN